LWRLGPCRTDDLDEGIFHAPFSGARRSHSPGTAPAARLGRCRGSPSVRRDGEEYRRRGLLNLGVLPSSAAETFPLRNTPPRANGCARGRVPRTGAHRYTRKQVSGGTAAEHGLTLKTLLRTLAASCRNWI